MLQYILYFILQYFVTKDILMSDIEQNDAENKKQQKVRCLYAGLYLSHTKHSQLYGKHKVNKDTMINSHIDSLQHKKKKPNQKLVQMHFLKQSKMIILGYDKQAQRGDINFIDASQPKIKDFFYNKLDGGVGGIQFFQNGHNILIADRKGMFSFIDLFKGLNINDIDDKRIQTGIDGILDVSLAPSQTKIVCGLADKKCVVCDIEKERKHKKIPILKTFDKHIYGVGSVDWHPYKSLVVSSSIHLSDTVKLWDPHSEELVHETSMHKSIVSKVMFHPQGHTYFSIGKDNMIAENQLRKRGVVNKFCLQFQPNHMQVLRNGNIVVGDNGGYMTWFTPTGQFIGNFKGPSGVALFSIDQSNNLLVLGRQREHMFQIYSKPDAFKIGHH